MMIDAKLGRLRAATISCPNFPLATAAYRDYLGYQLVEEGRIDRQLADAWGAPKVAGKRYQWLIPRSGTDIGIRLVEQPEDADFQPYSSLGWNALEIAVADCDRAVAQVAEGPFRVVGPPAELGFSDGALRAGQVVGPSGEVFYLTEIRRDVPGFDLPRAKCLIDQPFIVILHSSDAAKTIEAYRLRHGNAGSPTFEFPVAFMAAFQSLPPQHPYTLGTVALEGGGYFEVDGAPPHIPPRPIGNGLLPPGIAMVSVEARISQDHAKPAGAFYDGAAIDKIIGDSGEWLEIVSPSI